MKIGIVSTYSWLKKWDNYGTVLQNYALQHYLRQHGHEAFWIRTIDPVAPKGGRPSLRGVKYDSPRRLFARAKQSIRSYLKNFHRTRELKRFQSKIADFNRAHPRQMGEFFNKYIEHTAREYTLPDLIAAPPDADIYIVGSDQVWKSSSPLYFLGFGTAEIKRIAYGVSAPWSSLSPEWYGIAKEYVGRFRAVSVREHDGLEICARIGRADAVHVVDPTLLLDKDDYLTLAAHEVGHDHDQRTSVLCYFVNKLTRDEISWDAIEQFAINRNARLKVVPLQGSELVFPQEFVCTPSPSKWLALFNRADAVFTNSFHGAVFAVIMRKPFLVILPSGRAARENYRMNSFLEHLGLQARIVEGSESMTANEIEARMVSDIRWDLVQSKLEVWRGTSERFLLNSIQ